MEKMAHIFGMSFGGQGPGAVGKAACLESRRSRARTPLWPTSYKETKCFFPARS